MNLPAYRPALIALLFFSVCVHSHAAGPGVDAGSLLRQSEQDLNFKKSAPPAVQPAPAKPGTKLSGGEAAVQVSSFKFIGNTLLSSEALNRALNEFILRPLTLDQLREATDAVVNVYRSAGWTVHAYLPKQEIQDGIVTIQIVEAVFGGAQMLGPAPTRVGAKRLIRMAEANLIKGKPLHADQINRTLLLLDDLPGVSVSGNLIAGNKNGETDVALSATDEPLFTGNVSADNQGSHATGPERLYVNLNINSPAHLGDAMAINAIKSQGINYERIAYAVPLGYQGWRIGLHASNLTYRVITNEYASLDPHGTAITAGWDLSYPILRGQTQNINFGLSYDDKSFDNTSNAITSSYGIKAYTTFLTANQLDNWRGGGSTSAGLSLTSGANDSTDVRYNKFNLNLSRRQSLTKDLNIFASFTAQTTNKNLDSSEKMYLGGSGGIRAYPSSEAGGSEGWLTILEVRQRLEHEITLSGFYDYGWIRVNHNNSVTSPASPNGYSLKGYGVAVAWQPTLGMDIKCTIAQRSGDNPAALANGTDSDGTKKITRIWLSVGFAF
jgi:hemolysin activation/secretion protein